MPRGARALDFDSSPTETFGGMRSDYAAAKSSPYRRRRTGTLPYGTHADWHYRVEVSFTDAREQARDFDRNDAVVGSIVDRAVSNMLMEGISPDPKTADRGVNRELKARWKEWAEDAELCDQAGEHEFHVLERFAMRQTLVDGDICCVALQDGQLATMEAHRLRTPSNTKKNVVHGVLLDDNRRRLQYWFTKEDIDAYTSLERVSDITPVDVRDADGGRQLFHIYDPKRISQTRGVSAFLPIFDRLGMVEDIDFATLVKQQVSSCFAIFRERDDRFSGPDAEGTSDETQQPGSDGVYRTLKGLAPGAEITGKAGEKLTGFSPNIPNTEFFQHLKLILSIIGINLGMPLVMVLMDAGETNFSGYRGAVEQARLGFRRNQKWLVGRLHKPVYRWKVRQWLADDPALRRAAEQLARAVRASAGNVQPSIFNCRWHLPAWPYIKPSEDSATDALEMQSCLNSPRRIQARKGSDWDDIMPETIDDNARGILRAAKTAAKLNKVLKTFEMPPIHWRELLPLPLPKGITERLQGEDDSESEDGSTAPTKPTPAKKPARKKAV